MRFYETRYPDFYVENLNPWENVCRTPQKSWRKKLTHQEVNGPSTIFYWRDVEGSRKPAILPDDYRFNNWQRSRLNHKTLPLNYKMGNRFIKIEKDFPAGFNFKFRPMSLVEVHAIDGIVLGKKRKRRH